MAQIARRDYMKKNDLDDEDEDEDTGEGYDIDPSTNMWKPIEFGKSYSKKNIISGFNSSNSETKLPSVSGNPSAGNKQSLKMFPDIKEGTKSEPKPPDRSHESSALPSVSLPTVAVPKPLTDPPKKKSSPRMSKQEFDEVNSLICGLNPVTAPPLVQPPSQQQLERLKEQERQKQQERQRQAEIDQLLKEKELMQQKLELIEKEKKEMSQRTTELTTQLLLTSQQRQHEEEVERLTKLAKEKQEQQKIELLTREKEEMKRMIEQIKSEKDEELSRLVIQRNTERSHESELLTREREILRNELEQVRVQNELLTKQMKSTQLLSQQEIEEVKLQRVQEVTAIEEKNKKITEEILSKQAESERKLAAERDELKLALQRMENEKLLMSQKIYSTETAAKKETAHLQKQRKEYEMKLLSMENEKSKLYEMVAANEIKLKTSSDSAAAKLTEELNSLSSQLSRLENEKKSLQGNIQESEAKTSKVMEELKLRLDREKDEYRECIQRMEEEKMEMATLLTKTEKEAKEYAIEVRAQLKREQEEMEATKRSINEERGRLEQMLNEVNRKRNELEQEVREEVKEMKDAARTEVQNEVKEVNKVKLELEQTLEMIRREKVEMELRLKEAADQAIQRERELAEQVCRERDELRKAVERMREEMEEEKKRREEERRLQEEQQSAAPAPKKLGSSSSLFNLMEEEGIASSAASHSEKSTRHNRSCAAMVPIVEVPSHDLSEENTTLEIHDVEETNGNSEHSPTAEGDPQLTNTELLEAEEETEPDEFVDLPLPHAAAARGDLSTLESLQQLDPSLLASFDSAGRTPLFYAVAYNHAMLTSYLMDASPECIFQTDCHGDAPLHAAASSGSSQCVDLIVRAMAERGVEGVDIRNNMGMTPAHLASNAEVLSMLHAAGANLSIPDHNHRTALFVAAAMNRQDCVQYFIDCFDSLSDENDEENIIYLADNRGDTPLHAAACNGAEESLLLLLQCGISPLRLNHRGLKAIDLAQKNKKKKCREILAQYHLHFATTSDFDSVLFIAALEGQKKVQDAMMNALASPEDHEGYNIIKNCHIENLQDEEVTPSPTSSYFPHCLSREKKL